MYWTWLLFISSAFLVPVFKWNEFRNRKTNLLYLLIYTKAKGSNAHLPNI